MVVLHRRGAIARLTALLRLLSFPVGEGGSPRSGETDGARRGRVRRSRIGRGRAGPAGMRRGVSASRSTPDGVPPYRSPRLSPRTPLPYRRRRGFYLGEVYFHTPGILSRMSGAASRSASLFPSFVSERVLTRMNQVLIHKRPPRYLRPPRRSPAPLFDKAHDAGKEAKLWVAAAPPCRRTGLTRCPPAGLPIGPVTSSTFFRLSLKAPTRARNRGRTGARQHRVRHPSWPRQGRL